jgi:hypothetical protein
MNENGRGLFILGFSMKEPIQAASFPRDNSFPPEMLTIVKENVRFKRFLLFWCLKGSYDIGFRPSGSV